MHLAKTSGRQAGGYREAHRFALAPPHAAFFARRPTWAWKPDLMGATDRPEERNKDNADSQRVMSEGRQMQEGRTRSARLAVHEEDAVLLRKERVWRLARRAGDVLDWRGEGLG